MRIVCDACEAKYSIADDKVSGKVFKIRCKKCSKVIVVRGAERADVPVMTDPAAPAIESDASWYLVVEQAQVGPFTEDDVRARIDAGELDRELFAWREGMAEWLPLAQIEAFAARAGAADEPPDDTARAPRLRGERNESSVLFSLHTLAQIANPRPAPVAASSTAPGSAAGEGSGLIDIRSMASAYLGTRTPAPAARASAIGTVDDLPQFATGGFAEPAVIVPRARAASSRTLVYLVIAAIGMLGVAATLLVVLLLGGSKQAVEIATATATMSPRTEPASVATGMPAATTPPPASIPVASTPVPAAPPVTPAAPPTPVKAKKTHPPATATHAADTHAADSHATDSHDTECSEVTCIVNSYEGACCARFKHATTTTATPAASTLPDHLDRDMINAGLAPVKSRVTTCGARSSARGQVRVHVKVAGDGHVAAASVETAPDPALGSCVSALVEKASFAKTQHGGSFAIPFVF